MRELKNVVERLAVRAPGEDIQTRDLPEECRNGRSGSDRQTAADLAMPKTDVADDLVTRMIAHGESFWTAVHAPFLDRDLVRAHVRAVVKVGLEQTAGNYRMVLELFNLPPSDYKRFLSFLRKHNCHYPVQAFRVPVRSVRHTASGAGKMWLDGHPFEAARQQSRLGRGPHPAGSNVFYPPGAPAGAGISLDRLRGQPCAS